MPVKSGKQYRLFQAIAHSKKKNLDVGPSKEVAEKFIAETPREKRKLFTKQGKR